MGNFQAHLDGQLVEDLRANKDQALLIYLGGKPIAAVAETLPSEVVEAARARGRRLDWWETAEALLEELGELGWMGN